MLIGLPRPNDGSIFFACPKKIDKKKRHPHFPPYGYPVLLTETGAAQLALCSALIALKHVLAMIPFRLRCAAGNEWGF